MARVSKKVSAAQREAENAQHRIWKTAIKMQFWHLKRFIKRVIKLF